MKSTGFIEARKERAVAINKSCHKRIEECFAGTLQQEQLILLLHGLYSGAGTGLPYAGGRV